MNKNSHDKQETIGPWQFDASKSEIRHQDGHVIKLEEKIAKLLSALLENRGAIVSKESLIERVWAGRELSEQTIPVAISKLRKALGDDINKPTMLETIPRQGYRLLTPTNSRFNNPASDKFGRLPVWAAAVLVIVIASALFLQPENPAQEQIQFLNADKPHVIVTINDVRVADGNQEDTGLAISVSELAAYYLAQTPDLLVIRHWWNLDAPDPTGGIYTRYGEATPVYSLKGTLLKEQDNYMVTFSLSDPKTDEVIWSGLHSVDNGSKQLFPMFNLMLAELPVDTFPTQAKAPEESDAYWRARYFYELSNPGAAGIAARELSGLLGAGEQNPTVRAMADGLIARWNTVPEVSTFAANTSTLSVNTHDIGAPESNYLIDLAAKTLFGEQNPDKTLGFIEDALSIAPGDHFAHSIRGEALAAKGDIKPALEAYRLAFRLAPYAKAYEARMAVLSEELVAKRSD